MIASQQLSGAAATWYEATRSGPSAPATWIDLKNGLLQRFGGTRSAAVARLEIGRLHWKEGQDLEEHITRFTAIRSRITDATEGELVSNFRQTLPAAYLSDSLYREPKTLDEAIGYTRSLHASRCHGHHPTPHKPRPTDSTGPAPMDLDTQQLVRTLQALGFRAGGQQFNNNPDERKCYRCGKRGHIARFCRQRQSKEASGQRYAQQSSSSWNAEARTRRLAELAYQIEQLQPQQGQQQQQQVSSVEESGQAVSGKEPCQ